MTVEKRNGRNEAGVKWSCDQCRTINGAHYVCWITCPSPDRVSAYKAAKVRCARRGDDLYVHHMDANEAAAVDEAAEAR